jgi:arylsulfatase A-like enzyme
VGEILTKLDELGLTDNTLVIFTSDHGEMLGSHGMREKNVFYEESAHIPLLIRFPDEIKSNTRVDGYISTIDLFPTILDYLEIEEHPSDGKSLRGLMEGRDTLHGKYVVTEWDYRGDSESNYMILKDGWKMIIPYSDSSQVLNALFYLEEDPYEMNNLLERVPIKARYTEKVEELRADLIEWMIRTGSSHLEGVRKRKVY